MISDMLRSCSLIAALLLSACATEVGRGEAFDTSHEDSMVVLGVRSNVGIYKMRFTKIDPDTCQSDNLPGKTFDHSSVFSAKAYKDQSRKHFIMDTFSPGLWVVEGLTLDARMQIIHYDFGTIGFDAKPGEFIYLGDIVLGDKNIAYEGHDRPALDAYLKDFPKLTGSPADYSPKYTKFDRAGTQKSCGDAAKVITEIARNKEQDEWYRR